MSTGSSNANFYPIRAVSQLTGVSPDSIRAWERRYSAITPKRAKGGRLYSEDDVRRLRLLKRAVDHGHSIGQIARLEDSALEGLPLTRSEELLRSDDEEDRSGREISKVIAFIDDYDTLGADRLLGRLATLYSPREFVHMIVAPLMQKVGQFWRQGRWAIAQEHMTSAIMRNVLGTMLRLYSKEEVGKRLIFATPSGESHEFGILVTSMLTVAGGVGVTYLGANLPAEEVVRAAKKIKPAAVVLSMVCGKNTTEQNKAYLDKLKKSLPNGTEVVLGGKMLPDLIHYSQDVGCVYLESFEQFEGYVKKYGARF